MSDAATPKPVPGQPAPPAGLPEDAIEVGRVLGAWGVQGGLRIKPLAADPQALFSTKRWFLAPSEQARPVGPKAAAAPLPDVLRIKSAREQGDSIVATVHDLDDRDAAEALKGARIFVPRTSFPTPDEGEFYWVDLIGCSVVNREGQTLGTVDTLIETGPHCVLRILDAEGAERLVPFVDAFVDTVDQAARRITVDWGLDY